MFTWLDKVVCVWDAVAVAGYVILTLLIYSSTVLPFLNDLAAHGKTRANVAPSSKPHESSNKTFIESFICWFNQSEAFLVKKKHFRQFYLVAILCFTALLYIWIVQMQLLQPPTNEQNRTSFSQSQFVPPLPYDKVFSISSALLYLHFLRRFYECSYVHQWKETSVMHIAGYLVGIIHYIWLPHAFVRIPCHQCWATLAPKYYPSVLFPAPTSRWENSALFPLGTQNTLPLYVCRVIGVCLCLYGQYQQYRHHVLLANLRKGPSSKTEDPDKKSSTTYSLPTDGWFQWITCPHYLAEILIYVSFTILLELEKPHGLYHGMRHVLVLIWVASNLTLSARINHQWYLKNLPPALIKGKKAIIPYIL